MNLAIPLIKEFEGCKLKAYLCPANVWTIGYGHTNGVKERDEITQQEADRLLVSDVDLFTAGVQRLVTSDINRNQLGALVSFAFNLGLGNLRHSTLLKLVNAGDFVKAANEFDKWVYVAKHKLNGLVRRRAAEKALFLKEDDAA